MTNNNEPISIREWERQAELSRRRAAERRTRPRGWWPAWWAYILLPLAVVCSICTVGAIAIALVRLFS